MNIIKFNKRIYRYESLWRNNKYVKITDSTGDILPWPKPSIHWQMQTVFVDKLVETERNMRRQNKFMRYPTEKYKDCLLCDAKKIATGLFGLNNIRWENSLTHYIKEHNVKPSERFVDMIFRYRIGPEILYKKEARIKGTKIVKYNKTYLKLDRNQILILDALMKHGSYRRYVDTDDKAFFRYSEHAGILDFDNGGLERVVVSGNTTRIDQNDDDIFLPSDMIDMFDYEYIFHTHPATNGPGGRAPTGVLYEFPSIGDIFHFMDHYNDGKTQGSIVITAEGMYIIRKLNHDDKNIEIDENKFYREAYKLHRNIQEAAIKMYGTSFTSDTFFSVIAQNRTYINDINSVLKRYQMYIDYYPRIKDQKNKWIIDTVYIPVYVVEPEKSETLANI